MNGNVKWHLYTARAVEEELHTNASCGLSRKEARSRYRKLGANGLFDEKASLTRVKYQAILCDPALLLLLFLCLIAICFFDAWAGLSALACFALGAAFAIRLFVLERKAETDIAAYRVPTVTVIRDGKPYTTSARNIVVGDVLLLHAGDIVPCDCRLIEATDLRVLTLYHGQNKKAAYAELPKNADLVYPYGSVIQAPFAENMLYGGSELLSGTATAIAVETDTHTFIGGISDFSIPAEARGKAETDVAGYAKPYIKLYAFLLFVLLLPLAVIGMLTLPRESGLLSLFLSLSAPIGGASVSYTLLYLQTPSIRLCHECFDQKNQKQYIIKSSRAMMGAAEASELIVLGRCGSSDGKLHLYRVITGEGEVQQEQESSSVTALCEAFQLYHTALLARNRRLPADDHLKTLRNELTQLCDYDTAALRMRLLQATFLTPTEQDEQLLSVTVREGEYKLLFSDRSDWIKRCTFFDQNGRSVFWSPEVREKVLRAIDAARSDGCRLQLVIKQQEKGLCFVGAVALRESEQEILPSVLQELQAFGVRVSFFLATDDQESKQYAAQVKLPLQYLSRHDLEATPNLLDYYGKYRVFLGFSDDEIEKLIVSLRRSGASVAVLGSRREQLALMRKGSLLISCDTLPYHQKQMKENLHELMEEDGLENSERTSQAIRRRADALIGRADRTQGGLSAILQMIHDCREQRTRACSAFRFLYAVQIPLLVMTLLAVVFGRGLLSGAQLLYGGAITSIIGLLWLLWIPIKAKRLHKPIILQKKIGEETLTDKGLLLPPLIASAVTGLYALILSVFDAIPASSCAPYLFFSLLFIQLLSLGFEARRAGFSPSRLQAVCPIMILLFPALLAAVLSSLFVASDAALLMGGWNPITLLSLPLSVVIYLLVSLILSKRFGRTAK